MVAAVEARARAAAAAPSVVEPPPVRGDLGELPPATSVSCACARLRLPALLGESSLAASSVMLASIDDVGLSSPPMPAPPAPVSGGGGGNCISSGGGSPAPRVDAILTG